MNIHSLVHALTDGGVEFVIIGGWSAILHGSSRSTLDLDCCFSQRRTNIENLVRSLAVFHPRLRNFPPELPFIWDEATVETPPC
jgi:hypothetical protein